MNIEKLVSKYEGSEIPTFENILAFNQYENRVIVLGEITSESSTEILCWIRMWNKQDEEDNIEEDKRVPIKIYIDSEGGDLYACFSIVDTIKMSKTPVHTICYGSALSSGGLILISGHKRYAFPHSSFCWHLGSAGTAGDATKFINFADFYKVQLEKIKEFTVENTLITREVLDTKDREDWWMSAEEMKEHGIVDEIIDYLM